MISLGFFVFIRRAPRGIGNWLQAYARELQTTFAALLLSGFFEATPSIEQRGALVLPPPERAAAIPPVSAPAGFTSGVMSRVRALPAPVAAPPSRPIAALWASPVTQGGLAASDRSALPLLGIFLATGGAVMALLVAGCVYAVTNPTVEMLVFSLLVSLLILLLSALHIVTQTINIVATNMWVAVPMLVTLLSVVLIAWSQIARLIGSQTVEV